jgi:hypothetical protein
MINLRRSFVAIAGATVLLSGCGGNELPSKSEFVDQVKESMGTDVTSSLEGAGIDKATATGIMEDFIGCIYDEIKDDEELLQQAFDDGGDKSVEANIEKQAAACTDDLTTAVSEAATGG